MKVFITGGAGFIGSHLCEKLLAQGHEVTAYDNLLLGRREYLSPCLKSTKFTFIEADLRTDTGLSSALKGSDLVFHLAANSDISSGPGNTELDFQHGLLATYKLLEAMKTAGPNKIVFSSTSAIYGDALIKPTPEGYGPLYPQSFYGASKLSCEGFVSAYSYNFPIQSWIYRFANIVGPRLTHGVIFDFITRLKKNPETLNVLGNGTQRKSYLHVNDCISGMLFGLENAKNRVNIFNLASEGTTDVKTIAEEVVRQMGTKSKIVYGKEDRGWVGDIPHTWLNADQLQQLGWKSQMNSSQAIIQSIQEAIHHWGS